MKTFPKYIFVTGGVISGLGKGIATSSIAKLLQARGYRVSAMKIDPYLNVDAGTMNPTEHGEVFVTKDGMETDQDIGNYERFLNVHLTRDSYMTNGQVYLSVLERERSLDYHGKTVEIVPHIPQEIIRRIKKAARVSRAQFQLVEIGGTIGEYQNALFLEAARIMHMHEPENVQFIMVSYLPIPSNLGEMKTKPTQYAVRTLNAAGIQPNFIIARGERPMDEPRKQKLSENCNLKKEDIISAPDVTNIYEVPLNFERDHLTNRLLKKFKLPSRSTDLRSWRRLVRRARTARSQVKIGIVGKYFETGDFTLTDSYISVIEAIRHAAWSQNVRPVIEWLSTERYEKDPSLVKELSQYDGIIVPQGWGSRGAEGKIAAIKYLREKKIPYFGLCYGMQMAVIEFARHVARLRDANSEEVNPKTPHPVIHIMEHQKKLLEQKHFGGTIRLGEWPCKLTPGTTTARSYGKKKVILERHRHRFEFNNAYREKLESKGLTISGTSPDGTLVESIEIQDHPFFVATQFHPEYISSLLNPHPLFVGFIKAAHRQTKKR